MLERSEGDNYSIGCSENPSIFALSMPRGRCQFNHILYSNDIKNKKEPIKKMNVGDS